MCVYLKGTTSSLVCYQEVCQRNDGAAKAPGIWAYYRGNPQRYAVRLDLVLGLTYPCIYENRRCMGRWHATMTDRNVLEVSHGDHTEPYHCPVPRQGSGSTIFCPTLWSDV